MPKVEIRPVSIEQSPVLFRLMQLYLHDLSEIEGTEINEEGLFEYKYLDLYWQEEARRPFIIYVDGNLAGFVLVNAHVYLEYPDPVHSIAEFFVMRKYRRKGIGRGAAFQIFDKFPGYWEVREMGDNLVAQQFWRKVIGEYTQDNYSELPEGDGIWYGPIQSFSNLERKP